MRRRTAGIALLATGTALSGRSAFADPDAASLPPWRILKSEPSRGDLFAIVREEALSQSGSDREGRVLPTAFSFPRDTTFDEVAGKPRSDSIFGIDISHHNGPSVPLAKLRSHNVRFVYAKATQGVHFKDPRFAQHWTALAALPEADRPLRGAYHFLSSQHDGAAQARSFLRLLKESGGWKATDMPPVVDVEWDKTIRRPIDGWASRSADEIYAAIKGWLDTVKAETGRNALVYTNTYWWKQHFKDGTAAKNLAPHAFWIADYSKSARAVEEPSLPKGAKHHLWQFSESAELQLSPRTKFDANVFKGSAADFSRAFFG